MRIILFFLMTFFILTSCSQDNKTITTSFEKEKTETGYLDKESQNINKYGYMIPPYTGCKWVKKTGSGIEVWTQECEVNNTLLTVNPSKTFPGFFVEINSGKGYVSEKLAIQVFDTTGSKTTLDALDKVKNELIQTNFVKKEDNCMFKKEEILSNESKKIFTLMKQNGEACSEYSYDSKGEEIRYFEVKGENKNKVIFINQLAKKQLFDNGNIKIVE